MAWRRFIESGAVFKLEFGPKAFIVVSDPVVVRHLLKENATNYDKGVLAEILEPIMGKGLIPADLETWKPRRRAIVPAFHKAYLDRCIDMFADCTERTIDRLEGLLEGPPGTATVNMETEWLNLGLDIIGLGVFNYDFGSINNESPVIQAHSPPPPLPPPTGGPTWLLACQTPSCQPVLYPLRPQPCPPVEAA